MQICYKHYYCLCGRYEKICHYCRKQKKFYRRHFICLDCCIGWKSKNEIKLISSIDGGQLHEIEDFTYAGSRCRKCSKDSDEIGRDFRVPKQSDIKSWNNLKTLKVNLKDNFSSYMIKKYTYNCNRLKK